MKHLTLRYSEDRATGLPRLDDPSGKLGDHELGLLQDELSRHFERLASGPDQQFLALDIPARPDLPNCFRVTIIDRQKRCPTLLLEMVEPTIDADPLPATGAPSPSRADRWQAQLVAEFAELLAKAPDESSPLGFVLSNLRTQLRKHPDKLALLFFAGYLHVSDAISRKHGEARDSQYTSAAQALLQLAGDALPEGALDPLLCRAEPAADTEPATRQTKSRGWLRRLWPFA